MNWKHALVVFTLLLVPLLHSQDKPGSFHIEPNIVLIDVPFDAVIIATDADGAEDPNFAGKVTLTLERSQSGTYVKELEFTLEDGGRKSVTGDKSLVVSSSDISSLRAEGVGRSAKIALAPLPGWTSILPPLLAIFFAIAFRQVLVALVLGILGGALLINGFDPVRMLMSFVDTYIVQSVTGIKPFRDPDASHAQIIIFSLLLGGMTGVMSRSGGLHGIVHHLIRWARGRRSGQLATAGLGTVIFFDDYANCLIVGNTTRPLTDRLKISREKLAYIVDSTAAPVASLIPLSTWVGFQVGQVDAALKTLPGGYTVPAYGMILEAIPFMFYPIFALLLVFVIGATGRDMFSMLKAERRAAREGKVLRDGAVPLAGGEEDEAIQPLPEKPQRAMNALIPILGVIIVTIVGLVVTGSGSADLSGGFFSDVRAVIANADSYTALLWASITGVTLAMVLAVVQRILTVNQAMEACAAGMKAMFLAFIILVLSWALGAVTSELHAEDYLAGLLTGNLDPLWLPIVVFGLAAFTSFATGSAWGTMGILIPLAVPLAFQLSTAAGLDPEVVHRVLLGCIASVLGGAVFGDHCSPISDTTVLSSMATSCDHIDHVRTQLPYAVLAGVFAVGLGYIPESMGYSALVVWPVGILLLILLVRFVARPVEGGSPDDPDENGDAVEVAVVQE